LKCRFVACRSPMTQDGAPTAYVTSMAKGKVFEVNLAGETSRVMFLTKKASDADLMPPPPNPGGKPAERTFVNEVTFADETCADETFAVQEPTGVAVDNRSGDLFIADKSSNSIYKFDSDGCLKTTVQSVPVANHPESGKGLQMSPIGIHYSDQLLYVASNKSRSVFVCKPCP